jgi:arylsulfatase
MCNSPLNASDGRPGALSPGKHTILFDFKYDGPGFGKVALGSVGGRQGSGHKTMPHTIPFLVSMDESFDVGKTPAMV